MPGDATGSAHGLQPDAAASADDPAALTRARWFAGKGRVVETVERVDVVPVPESGGGALAIVAVTYADGGRERYLLPVVAGDRLVEAPAEHPLWAALARVAGAGGALRGAAGVVEAEPGSEPPASGGGRLLTIDQSNTSVVLGGRTVVKCYRRLEEGVHPEPELLAALTRAGCRAAARYGGSLTYVAGGERLALATIYAYVPGDPVGWEALIAELARHVGVADRPLGTTVGDELGTATAALHVALADVLGTVRGTAADAARAERAAREQLDEALAALPPADGLHRLRAAISHGLAGFELLDGALLTRAHGDLHVAQFVRGADGLVAVDWEGEPGRALDERRRTVSPLRDLACLLLSLDHVAVAAARRRPDEPGALDRALAWSSHARAAALEAYERGVAGTGIAMDVTLLRALELEKECRELLYAATVLPEWLYVPRATLPLLLERR